MNAFAELALFAALFFVCMANVRRYPLLLLLLPLTFFCIAMALLGYTKSAYHLLLVGLAFYATRPVIWPTLGKAFVKYFLIAILFYLSFQEILTSDWSFQNKVMVPQFYYLWGAILILNGAKRNWLTNVAILLIVLDFIVSFYVSARGMMIGSALALLFFVNGLSSRHAAILFVLLSGSVLYTFVLPYVLLYSNSFFINETASNVQRSLMNISALLASTDSIITLDEFKIYGSAADHMYSHDDSNLTVHNLFLAFSLFNGLLPAVILFAVLVRSISKLASTSYLPFAIFLFFLMLLGPDSFNTRFALLVVLSLVIIHAGSFNLTATRSGFYKGIVWSRVSKRHRSIN